MSTAAVASSPRPVAIHVADVTKTFTPRGKNPVHALRGVSFDIRVGEIVALLGTNGAGKSTLIDIILGLTTATSGQVSVLGGTPKQATGNARIGAVMQTGGLLTDITVKDTLNLVAAAFPTHRPLDSVVERANLEPILRRRVGKCSGGERQRLRFALALLGDPDIIILDEPTAGMDAGARHAFWDAMRLEAAAGRTIIFATHYLEEADQFSERVILLDQGQVLIDAPSHTLLATSPTRLLTAEFPAGIPDDLHLPADAELERDGNILRVRTADADSLARALLTCTDACNLTIAAHTLEDTFLELTSKNANRTE